MSLNTHRVNIVCLSLSAKRLNEYLRNVAAQLKLIYLTLPNFERCDWSIVPQLGVRGNAVIGPNWEILEASESTNHMDENVGRHQSYRYPNF